MSHNTRFRTSIFSIAACFAAFALAALTATTRGAEASTGELTADDIVDRIQARYSVVSDFGATFVQTTAHKLFPGRLERSYGTVMFKKGGLMRWEYARPEKKLFVYDGSTLWVYEPEVPQAFKATANAARLRNALAFLNGEGRIKESYKAEKLDAARFAFTAGFVLKLTPLDKNSPFKKIELYVSSTDFHVVRSVVVDNEGNRNRFDFSNFAYNGGLAASLFTFSPPAGVPVIDPAE